MAHTPPEHVVQGERLFTEFRGALVESLVAQQLIALDHPDLFYWRSSGGKAELDFLCEISGRVVPMEVKASLSRRSKSMQSYDRQFAPDLMVRANLCNLKQDDKICNVPFYAISLLRRLATSADRNGGSRAR